MSRLLCTLFIILLFVVPEALALTTVTDGPFTLTIWDSSDHEDVYSNHVVFYAEYEYNGVPVTDAQCSFVHHYRTTPSASQEMIFDQGVYAIVADGAYIPGRTWHVPPGSYEFTVSCNDLTVSDDLVVNDYRPLIAQELAQMQPGTDRSIVYSVFNEFSKAHFGAEIEELTYVYGGDTLYVSPSSVWSHTSENSFFIGWETNLPALSYVEYGTTPQYGLTTDQAERMFYLHHHHLTGLQRDETYYYRIVSIDERGNKVFSPTNTFTTATIPDAIRFPTQPTGTTYNLNQDNSYYLLTQDIVSDGTAIYIQARNVTLDLNGHTITYGQGSSTNAYGVEWQNYPVGRGVRILNGRIVQGENPHMYNNSNSERFSGVMIRDSSQLQTYSGVHVEVAGITVEYYASQMWGMYFRLNRGGKHHIHHNVVNDIGVSVTNRHGSGTRSMGFTSTTINEHNTSYNLIKRTRQSGIGFGKYNLNNEVYIDSWAANSFGIQSYGQLDGGGKTDHNKVFGTGYYAIAIPWSTENQSFGYNFVHLEGINTGDTRWWESWGEQNIVFGLRLTQYNPGGQYRNLLDYHNSIVIVRGRDGSEIRGTGFFSDDTNYNFTMRNSVVKAEFLDDQTVSSGPIATQGHYLKEDSQPLLYINVSSISNLVNVRFGDSYGRGNNHYFINSTFERIGNDPRYHTFIFDGGYWGVGHVVRNPLFLGGARYDDVYWQSTSSLSNYALEWTLSLVSHPHNGVLILDKDGSLVFDGETDVHGRLAVPLRQTTIRPVNWFPGTTGSGVGSSIRDQHQKVDSTPHTIIVYDNDYMSSATLFMDDMKSLDLFPSGVKNLPPRITLLETAEVIFPLPLQLEAVVVDENPYTLSWSVITTPSQGTVAFSNVTSPVTNTTFSRAGNYVLRVSADDGEFITTSDIVVTVIASPSGPPQVISASTLLDDRTVYVSFNKPVTRESAQNTNNYHINGITIIDAWLADDYQSLTLTVSPMSRGQQYVLRMNNVQDWEGNNIVPNTETSILFTGSLMINFQPLSTTTPENYLADAGHLFDEKGASLSYGWSSDISDTARQRDRTDDIRYDTLVHMDLNDPSYWEISIPNGVYEVFVVAGDSRYTGSGDARHSVSVEGIVVFDGSTTTENPWLEGTVVVTVSDGRLTVDNGPNGRNTKIIFVHITPSLENPIVLGDLNRDGQVDWQDLLLVTSLHELVLVGRNWGVAS